MTRNPETIAFIALVEATKKIAYQAVYESAGQVDPEAVELAQQAINALENAGRVAKGQKKIDFTA